MKGSGAAAVKRMTEYRRVVAPAASGGDLVGLYGRVSGEVQGEKYGLSSQMFELRKAAAERGYRVVAEFTDDVSSQELRRPGLLALKDAARRGEFSVILALDPDRLMRSRIHQELFMEEMKKYARVECLSTPRTDTPESRLFFNLKGDIAEYEREKIKERACRGRREKARGNHDRGIPGRFNLNRAPYGYRWDPAHPGRLLIDDAQAEIVHRIFDELIAGRSLRGITLSLRADGIRSPKGGVWTRATVHRMLTNTLYVGRGIANRFETIRTYIGDKPIPDEMIRVQRERPQSEWIYIDCPRIVSDSAFSLAAAQLTVNKQTLLGREPVGYDYLLRGLIYCGRCAQRMGPESRRSEGRVRIVYRCRSRANDSRMAKPCEHQRNAKQIDVAVFERIMSTMQSPEAVAELVDAYRRRLSARGGETQSAVARLRRSLADVEKRQERAMDLHESGTVTKERSLKRLRALSDEHRMVTLQLAAAEDQLAAQGLSDEQYARVADACAKLGSENPERQREALRRMVTRVTCQSDGRLTIDGQIVALEAAIKGRLLSTPNHRSRQNPPVNFTLQVGGKA